MSSQSCDEVERDLVEALLAREAAPPHAAAHAASCARCGASARELDALRAGLDALPSPGASGLLVARSRRFARAELASAGGSDDEAERSAAVLPPGFVRECARLVAGGIAALPLVFGWNVLVLRVGGGVLSGVLPEPVLGVMGGAYLAGVAGALAFIYGSIPFVAHRRARRSHPEVTS
jgi:hypothetical protein